MKASLRFAEGVLYLLDQRRLPGEEVVLQVTSAAAAATAIADMAVRGAPLIGGAAAYGLYFAIAADASEGAIARATALLDGARPTAVNLRAALERVRAAVVQLPEGELAA